MEFLRQRWIVRAGLRALEERDAAVERWLREDVVAAYDALQADPAAPSLQARFLPPFAPPPGTKGAQAVNPKR